MAPERTRFVNVRAASEVDVAARVLEPFFASAAARSWAGAKPARYGRLQERHL